MSETCQSPLVAAYLERREDLRRFFAARLRSAAAAEDMVQEMYLKLASIGADADIRDHRAYLFRLGSNLMLDRIKQQRRAAVRYGEWLRAASAGDGNLAIADLPRADDAVAAKQRLAQIMDAVTGLPPACRRVFELHKLDGLTHSEVAQRLGISRSTVEKHMIAALRSLNSRLR